MIDLHRAGTALLAATYLAGANLASATTAEWTVVAKDRFATGVVIPDLPADSSWELLDIRLHDHGMGMLHLALERSAANELWRRGTNGLEPYARVDVTGALGPGRTGAESAHVFRSISSAPVDMGGDNVTVFSALAGPPFPSSLEFSTRGLWLASPSGKVEIARARVFVSGQSTSALDPGQGNLRFATSGNFVKRAWVLSENEVLVAASIVDPDTDPFAQRMALIKHVPGAGNQVCALSGEYLGQQVPFNDWQIQVARDGKIYVASSWFGDGFWRVCEGPATALVKEGQTGLLGPGLVSPTAYFPYPVEGLGQFAPAAGHSIFFSGRVFDSTPGQWEGTGIFRNGPDGNRPLALSGVQGALGSGLDGMPFTQIDTTFSPKVSGEYALFGGTVQTGGSTANGVWRISPEGAIEPVALNGTSDPQLAPEAGKVWQGLSAYQARIFANGHIVIKARAFPESDDSIWLLRQGRQPLRLLSEGDVIRVPTPTGYVNGVVDMILAPTLFGSGDEAGDGMFGADGSVLLQVGIEGFSLLSPLLVMRRVTDPTQLFADGFEP